VPLRGRELVVTMHGGSLGEVVCLGETMVAFVPGDGPRTFVATAAGAESNVAIGLARLGVRSRWVSRLGDDALGDLVHDELTGSGVDVDVVRDANRPTGVLIRMRVDDGTTTMYHRAGSAAAAMGIEDGRRVGSPAWLHVTGITPALSDGACGLVRSVVEGAGSGATVVSFDVNHRPALWPDARMASDTLTPFLERADVVFVGQDEADALFGTTDPFELADRFGMGPGRELVVKQGAAGAVAVVDGERWFERGLSAPVVDEAGAGDAFAAGYVAGHLLGWSAVDRLRLGHLMGARVVGVSEDHSPPFGDAERRLLDPEHLARRFASD
jgi:2-dehydro-3-deoxygluconokinase